MLGCVHLDAVASLVWNGWLPHPCDRSEQDVGPTEADDRELPECFRDVGPSPDGCPF